MGTSAKQEDNEMAQETRRDAIHRRGLVVLILLAGSSITLAIALPSIAAWMRLLGFVEMIAALIVAFTIWRRPRTAG